jgi:HEPN domain-containing protein
MSEKVIKNWLALAEYDIKSAKIMLETGRYLYVAFMCQQCIEKTLKAIFVKEIQTAPPYTHNLVTLANKLSCAEFLMQNYRKTIEDLNACYIESRYAEELEEISKGLTEMASRELFIKTEELLEWLKTKIQ